MTFTQLEQENARLRAEIVELRGLFTATTEKLGHVAQMVGFEPDVALADVVRQTRSKLGGVPAINQVTVEVAARWLEDHDRSDNGSARVIEKTADSWSRFAGDAQRLLAALKT